MKTEMKMIIAAVSLFAIVASFVAIADESDAALRVVFDPDNEEQQPYSDSVHEGQYKDQTLDEFWCWWDDLNVDKDKIFPVKISSNGENMLRPFYTVFQADFKGYDYNYEEKDVKVLGFKLYGIDSDNGSYQLDIMKIESDKISEENRYMNPDGTYTPGVYIFEDVVRFKVTYTDEQGRVYTAINLLAPFIVTKEKISISKPVNYIYDGYTKSFNYTDNLPFEKSKVLKEVTGKTDGVIVNYNKNGKNIGYTVSVAYDKNDTEAEQKYYINQTVTWFINPKNIEDTHYELLEKVWDVAITTTPITYGQTPSAENDVALHYYYSKYPARANSSLCDPVPTSDDDPFSEKYGAYTVEGVGVNDDRSKLEVKVTGVKNYTGTRTAFIDLIPLDLNQIGTELHVDTIHTDGSIVSTTFDDSNVFLFPIDKYIDETIYPAWGRGDYQLVALSARGGTIIDEPNGIISGETASEWNYMELIAKENSGYVGCVTGHFYEAFDGATAGIILNAAGNQVIGYNGVSENVVIPDMVNGHKITKIADKAFYNNKTIKSVVIGNNVTSIGMKAFAGCSKLTSVTIGDSVKVISYYAFHGCKNISEIDFGSKLTVVRNHAFAGLTFMDGESVLEPTAKNLAGNKFTASSKAVLVLS